MKHNPFPILPQIGRALLFAMMIMACVLVFIFVMSIVSQSPIDLPQRPVATHGRLIGSH